MTPLDFDEANHVYSVGTREVPGVTSTIGSTFGKGFQASEWYLQRGHAVHVAMDLWFQNKLDFDSLDEAIEGRVLALIKMVRETGFKPLCSEKRYYHKKYFYAGTVDTVGYLNGALTGLDWKASLDPRVRLQLAAYDELYFENNSVRWHQAAAVECHDDGTYKIFWMTKRELAEAKRAFLASLTCRNFADKHKIQ